MILQEIFDLVKIKIRPRDDGILDQYSRIFMVRLLLLCAGVCGVSWFTDGMNCLVPGYVPDSDEFQEYARVVEMTCWIQGVYIYRDLDSKLDDVAYYGITKDIDLDGQLKGTGALCKTYDRLKGEVNEACIPMEKTFFLQYQYMPFLLGVLALIYYLPYACFKVTSHDIIKLRQEIEKENPKTDALKIRKYFFRIRERTLREPKIVTEKRRRAIIMRCLLNLIVNVFYIAVNIATFFALDYVVNYKFSSLGSEMMKWSQLDHTEKYDYLGSKEHPKPTNAILPPFGYCEVHASAKDVKTAFVDQMKFVCELSQHLLYQYALVLLWIAVLVGILVSIAAFLIMFFKIINKVLGLRAKLEHSENRAVYKNLDYREIEYLDYLNQHDKILHGEVLEILREEIKQHSTIKYNV